MFERAVVNYKNETCARMILTAKADQLQLVRLLFPPSTLRIGNLLKQAEHFVESVNFVGRSNADGCTLVDGVDLDIQDGSTRNTIRGLASSLFNKESKRSGFEGQSELGWASLRSGVRENTLLLGELLVDIRDKTTRVSECVTVFHEMVNQLLVSGQVLGGTQVGRGKDLAVRADFDLASGADPWLKCSIRKLASLGSASIAEFVSSIIKGNQNSGTGSVKSNQRSHLVTSLGANQTSALGPDSHHGPDGPVIVNDGRPIQRIPAHSEFSIATFINIAHDRILFGSTLTDDLGGLDGVPNEVVSNDVNRKLCVTEVIHAAFDSNKSSAKGFCDFGTDIKHVLDDLLDLTI
mmetsp:Transcript_14119/g.39008  ORF Transcript_14119/g.39008 Transcript_14119/m.39008 type:complete len:350 (-) Transcript_14119:284-1333(-)